MRAEIPYRWKEAYVLPIPKKSRSNLPSSFRPISIVSIFARLFEKVVKSVIIKHLDGNKIIPREQHGFRNGSSTITQMLETLNDWTYELSLKRPVDVIYFVFEKAFDKVDHGFLIYKLHQVGLHGTIINWISEYFKNCTLK